MKKSYLFLCVCAALVQSICSCSNDDPSTDSIDKRVALILPSGTTVSRWADDAHYLIASLESYGYDPTIYTADETQDGAEKQVKQLEEALNAGYTHFIITPIDYSAINKSNLLQNHKDCDFICYDRMIMNNDAVDYFVTCNLDRIGEMQAQFLLQNFRASGKESMTIEYFAGPETDINALSFFNSAYNLLSSQNFTVQSGKTSYSDVALDSWSEEDARKEMLARLETIEVPDLILAPNDNVATGVIFALIEKGYITDFPVITGQDLTEQACINIRAGRQAMSIYKENQTMAGNAAIVVNSFISGNPVKTGKTFNNGAINVPVFYSEVSLVTIDNIDQVANIDKYID